MRFREIVGSTLCVAATLAAYADWQTLRTSDGRVVEVAAEFKIDGCSVAPNGDTTIEAWCMEGSEKLGLSLEISKPKKSEVAQPGGEAPLLIFRSDLAIRPIGQSTKHLEELVRAQLGADGKFESELRVVGLYSATASVLGGSVARPSVFIAHDVGLTFSDSGASTFGQCFALTLFVDAPTNRLIAYFSLPGGYGGTSVANQTRLKWYDALPKKRANQSPEPTAMSVTPPAAQEPRQP